MRGSGTIASGFTWFLGGAVFVVSFLFRFIEQPELTNDFFMHVVGGRQMLLGDWPVRDFVDLGQPLMLAQVYRVDRPFCRFWLYFGIDMSVSC